MSDVSECVILFACRHRKNERDITLEPPPQGVYDDEQEMDAAEFATAMTRAAKIDAGTLVATSQVSCFVDRVELMPPGS